MSYLSENTLPKGTSLKDVIELLESLGYIKIYCPKIKATNEIARFDWYERKNYQSWRGVQLSISQKKDSLIIDTQTLGGRSYCDLEKQNTTIRLLRKRFGGYFHTDEGKNRYFHPEGKPPSPQQSGCHIAFQRFSSNLIHADIYLMDRKFPNRWDNTGIIDLLDQMNPRLLSNNLLVPYLVTCMEDYFKSTFIALLSYSKKKELFLKNIRLSNNHLVRISNGDLSVEEAVAETLPFQRISAISRHFKALDSKIDIVGTLRKPYRRRKKKLLDEIEEFVDKRHAFIHLGRMDTKLSDKVLKKSMKDLEDSVVRCYKLITSHYGWEFDQGWFRGKNA